VSKWNNVKGVIVRSLEDARYSARRIDLIHAGHINQIVNNT
jgi:hypothetical protein